MTLSISDRLNGWIKPPAPTVAERASAPQSAVAPERAPGPARPDPLLLKSGLQKRIIAELDPRLDLSDTVRVRRVLEDLFGRILQDESIVLPRIERSRLFEAIAAEILSYGPIEPLLRDDTITEVMVNGPDQVWIERDGILYETEVHFEDEQHVLRIIDRIIAPLGRRCDESSPMVDARLPDGSRVNAIIPPLSLIGPVLTIRKFARDPLTAQNLIEFGTLTAELVDFMAACVRGRLNVIVSGGTSSGKTTLLNLLSSYIPSSERIVTIEDAAELQLRQRHVIPLEKRPPNIEGKGEIPIRNLVINTLRMRPDRIIVGECRGAEALDMLQAMNTGHDGSLTTIHSNSPRDSLSRIETMVIMAGTELPLKAIREQLASAINLIVHLERMQDGTRKVVKVSEVQGMEGEVVILQDIFVFQQTGVENRRVLGKLAPTGIRPKFASKLEAHGISLPPGVFGYDGRKER